jgi:predicted transcriptional regulator
MEVANSNILGTRRYIYECILKFPGLHSREISRKLKIAFSTLQYHLRFLEKRELIRGKNDGKYIRYYVSYQLGRREKDILSFLRKKTSCSIILYLLAFVIGSQSEISKSLKKHPTTIGFHLKKWKKRILLNN